MDPLIEVSTDRGSNMRETCARVLAAALMTGAIASVVAMSALFEAPHEAGSALTAPPSSSERSVRIAVHPLRRHEPGVRRRHLTQSTANRPVAPAAIARRIVRRSVVRRSPQRRRLADVKPPAPPAPAVPAAAAPVAPIAAAAATMPPADADPDKGKGHDEEGHGNGNGHGHGDEHGLGHEKHED
jgi:hypothetical protein